MRLGRSWFFALILIASAGCSKDPISPGPRELSGVVRQSDGSPAVLAWVSLKPRHDASGLYQVRITTADGGGSFSFTDVAPGEYVLAARAEPPDDHVAARRVRAGGLPVGAITLTLEPPGSVTGVATISNGFDFEGTFIRAESGFGFTTTDAGGAYRLDGVPSGTWRLIADRPGYTPREIELTIPTPGATVTAPALELSPATQAAVLTPTGVTRAVRYRP